MAAHFGEVFDGQCVAVVKKIVVMVVFHEGEKVVGVVVEVGGVDVLLVALVETLDLGFDEIAVEGDGVDGDRVVGRLGHVFAGRGFEKSAAQGGVEGEEEGFEGVVRIGLIEGGVVPVAVDVFDELAVAGGEEEAGMDAVVAEVDGGWVLGVGGGDDVGGEAGGEQEQGE